ncbi:MAG: Rhodanese domain protein [Herbinix sp.]|jgi:rhodanese-related sulfurtransferase|nr:Rhodanese domain protein [Herbinix sp.]
MLEFLRKDNNKVIHVNDMDSLIGTIELIDIREPYEYKSGCIKGARNIPMGSLLNTPESYLKKEKTYYIMCQSGARSKRTSSILTKQGFDVINVAGGMGSYVGTKRK